MSTFVVVMMKSLFGILSLAFLLIGVGTLSNQDLQGFREKGGVSSSYTPSESIPSAEFSESSTHYFSGILTSLSAPSITAPVKTLRFNHIPTVVHLLHLQSCSLFANRWKHLLSNTNSLKYTSGYYIYTLAHILI